ncbi:TPA: helix-turn-helix transcriptional regulator [Staphylococcus aureus]|nr:helix-turn-helix transcriptional regulator [Staphylococcus aureus]
MKNNLEIARVSLSMTQKELANKVGVTRQTISLIEKGVHNPSLSLCKNICSVLNKNLDEIFGEKPQ